ncbi:hypothetical protein FCE95_05400 [Luteimonas gilva]|uniref:Uncharacterized protein n=1 Tax=Luteimonas gilva TaxID=2572684 RepID=A0A4U5JVT0_9GAMM|nr:hypothetical protein [Luteimonas gilva]TKR33715.1 hypothetical protein FCE95_05400 [Luteimonas gilva]
MKQLIALPILLGLAGFAHAQDKGGCPQLPTAEFAWQQRAYGNTLLCRALRADGSEAFGLSITPEAPYDLKRANRRNTGSVGGQSVYWYEGQLATKPGALVRETMFELSNGSNAHVWIQSDSEAQLTQDMGVIQGLRFDNAQLSSK